MKISNNGLSIIKKYEGCRLKAYKCPAGVWTIGYGHTKGVYEGMVITQAQADALLIEDCAAAEHNVDKYRVKYQWNQNQFDSLVSFAFNIGSIDQLTAKGTRTIAQISNAIPLYNKASGKVLQGLVKRRADEKALFDKSGSVSNMNPYPVPTRVLKRTIPMMHGDDVKWVQYNVGCKADGWFGKDTEQKVKEYQLMHGLTIDGIVGMNTRAEMLNMWK